MGTVLEFKRKPAAADNRAVVESAAEPSPAPVAPAAPSQSTRPVHGGYPAPTNIGIPLALVKGQSFATPAINPMDPVVLQVVKTLHFYAKQGMDHGVMAVEALKKMGVIQMEEGAQA